MPSGWEVYYLVFLSGLLALLVPGALRVLSYIFSAATKRSKSGDPAELEAQKAQENESPHVTVRTASNLSALHHVNVRFFLATSVALILAASALSLAPIVSVFHSYDRDVAALGCVAVVLLTIFSGLGLLYSVRKGDLSWLSGFSQERPPEKPKSANATAEETS